CWGKFARAAGRDCAWRAIPEGGGFNADPASRSLILRPIPLLGQVRQGGRSGLRVARHPGGGRLQRGSRFAVFDPSAHSAAASKLASGLDRRIARCAGRVGGEGGIRTPGTLAGTSVFETDPIDHSGTSPRSPVSGAANIAGPGHALGPKGVRISPALLWH